jgi:hypothetical protein
MMQYRALEGEGRSPLVDSEILHVRSCWDAVPLSVTVEQNFLTSGWQNNVTGRGDASL